MSYRDRCDEAGYKYRLKPPKHSGSIDYWRKMSLKRYRQHCRMIDKFAENGDADSFTMHLNVSPYSRKIRAGGAPKHLRGRRGKKRKPTYHIKKLLDHGVPWDNFTFEHEDDAKAWQNWYEEEYRA